MCFGFRPFFRFISDPFEWWYDRSSAIPTAIPVLPTVTSGAANNKLVISRNKRQTSPKLTLVIGKVVREKGAGCIQRAILCSYPWTAVVAAVCAGSSAGGGGCGRDGQSRGQVWVRLVQML
jgi:hypothetical protein